MSSAELKVPRISFTRLSYTPLFWSMRYNQEVSRMAVVSLPAPLFHRVS